MAEAKSPVARPLSPHLQIYRLTLTMAMSIVHRITGGALYVGTPLLAWWLLAAASGPNAYATFQAVASSRPVVTYHAAGAVEVSPAAPIACATVRAPRHIRFTPA